MSDLPSLKKHYCPFCDKWFSNSSTQWGEVLYIHTPSVDHPENVLNFITYKPYWN